MTIIINFIILFIMFIGLICTLAPRLYGTIIILAAAAIYAGISGITYLSPWITGSLLGLVCVAELMARRMRILFTKSYQVSRVYSINTTVCNLGGMMVANALLGPIVGVTIWQSLVGKALLPRLDSIRQVLIRLAAIAALRFFCGLLMIVIVINYMMRTI